MLTATSDKVVKNFDKTCDAVVENCEPVIITRKNNNNVVIISQEDYNNLLENIYVRQSDANYSHLLESISQAKAAGLMPYEVD